MSYLTRSGISKSPTKSQGHEDSHNDAQQRQEPPIGAKCHQLKVSVTIERGWPVQHAPIKHLPNWGHPQTDQESRNRYLNLRVSNDSQWRRKGSSDNDEAGMDAPRKDFCVFREKEGAQTTLTTPHPLTQKRQFQEESPWDNACVNLRVDTQTQGLTAHIAARSGTQKPNIR